MGAAVAVNIPDGSITAADLDPSVLAPYALTDGSKPFTGQVTMQADAVVRDAVLFGQQGTALAPDATLTRIGAGALRLSSTGGAETKLDLATSNAVRAVQYSDAAGSPAWLWGTSGGNTDLVAYRYNPIGTFAGFPLSISRTTGTLTLTPDAGQPAINTAERVQTPEVYAGGQLTIHAGGSVVINPGSGLCAPVNETVNLGGPSPNRFAAVFAVAGTINTSSQDMKEGITPLSPERAMQAVRATEAVTFDYVAPTRGPAWYDLPDDPEQAEAVLQQRLTAAPLEAASRHQHGFLAEDCDPLFLVGEGQTSPGSSLGVLLAALQQLDARVQQLEGAA